MPIQFSCPHCGHSLSAPDSAAGVSGPCPKCRKTITAPSPPRPQATPVATRQPAPVVPAPTPVAPQEKDEAGEEEWEEYDPFVCTVCGGTEVQKVSAIVQMGTWTGGSTTVSATNGTLVGKEWGQGGGGSWVMGGVHGQTTHRTRTQMTTDLAGMLQPPREPVGPGKQETPLEIVWDSIGECLWLLLWGVLIGGLVAGVLGGIVVAAVLENGRLGAGIAIACGALGILIPVGITGVLIRERFQGRANYPARQRECAQQHAAWEEAMRRWDLLCFCTRCGNLYNPETGQAAPPGEMNVLLGR